MRSLTWCCSVMNGATWSLIFALLGDERRHLVVDFALLGDE